MRRLVVLGLAAALAASVLAWRCGRASSTRVPTERAQDPVSATSAESADAPPRGAAPVTRRQARPGSLAPASGRGITVAAATRYDAGERVFDILRSEPRIAAFADRREARIAEIMARRLAEARLPADVERVSCRASSCELEVAVEPELYEPVFQELQMPIYFDVLEPGESRVREDGKVAVSMGVLFAEEHLDHDAFDRFAASQEEALRRAFGDPPADPQ